MIAEYVPTDLSTIQKIKGIRNPSELEVEIAALSEILKDLNSHVWKQRLEALKKIQSIVVSEEIQSYQNFQQQLLKLQNPLTAQMMDQRSALTKEASKTIAVMAEVLQDDFETLALRFLHPNSLIKLVQNANKIISEQGHLSIVAIFHNVVSHKLIGKLFDEVKNKNPIVRAKISQYFLIALMTYPEEIIEKQYQVIEDYLNFALSDAKPEVRQVARLCFLRYKDLFPHRGKQIFNYLDQSVQKAIYDEEDSQSYEQHLSRMSQSSISQISRKSESSNTVNPAISVNKKQQALSNYPQSSKPIVTPKVYQEDRENENEEEDEDEDYLQIDSYTQKQLIQRQNPSSKASENHNNQYNHQSQKNTIFQAKSSVVSSSQNRIQGGGGVQDFDPNYTKQGRGVGMGGNIPAGDLRSNNVALPDKSTDYEQMGGGQNNRQPQNTTFDRNRTSSKKHRVNHHGGTYVNNYMDFPLQEDQETFDKMLSSNQDQMVNEKVILSFHKSNNGSRGVSQAHKNQQKQISSNTSGAIPTSYNNESQGQNGSKATPPQSKFSNTNEIADGQQISSKLQLLKSRTNMSQQNSQLQISRQGSQNQQQNKTVQLTQSQEEEEDIEDSISSIAPISNSIITEGGRSSKHAQESGGGFYDVGRGVESQFVVGSGNILADRNLANQRRFNNPDLNDSELLELKRKLSNPASTIQDYTQQEGGASGMVHFTRQAQQHAGQFEMNQNIEMLLDKAEKEGWSERLEAFVGLQQIIYEWIAIMGEARALGQQLTFQHLQVTQENIIRVLKCMTEHLGDNHFKVILVVQDSLCQLFQLFHEMFLPYLQSIIQRLLKNVTDKKEQVCQSANVLLNMFQQIYGGDQLVPILLKILEKAQSLQNKVLISCLEVLMVLLKDAYQFAMSQENIKLCVIKISTIASENAANKAVTLPIIGALLTLRDKNIYACMQALSLLDSKTLEIIKRLGHFYAPDLEENINEYIINRQKQRGDSAGQGQPLIRDRDYQGYEEDSPRTQLENKKQKLLARHPHSINSNQVDGANQKIFQPKDMPQLMSQSTTNATNNLRSPTSKFGQAQGGGMAAIGAVSPTLGGLTKGASFSNNNSQISQFSLCNQNPNHNQNALVSPFDDTGRANAKNNGVRANSGSHAGALGPHNLSLSNQPSLEEMKGNGAPIMSGGSSGGMHRVQPKLADMSVASGREDIDDEDTQSFLQIENQVKKQHQQQSDDILEGIINSSNGLQLVREQDLEMKGEILRRVQICNQEGKSDRLNSYAYHNLQQLILVITNLLDFSQYKQQQQTDDAIISKRNELREKAFELMFQLLQDNFKKFTELAKLPSHECRSPHNSNSVKQNSFFLIDEILQSIIENMQENKYVQKRAEHVFDLLLAWGHKNQQFAVSVLLSSIFKLTSLDQQVSSGLYIPVLLKLLCKLVKILSRSTLTQNSCQDELFKKMLQQNMNHQNPEIRKNVVFCLVEIRSTVGEQDFRSIFNKLPQSQQKLVTIYIERRQNTASSGSNQTSINQSQNGGNCI